MATNLTLASIKSTGGTTSRTIGNRFADVINVLDYGAKGDGIHDDTAAIQSALDAAFGPAGAPHGQSAQLNKAVFFPSGIYVVSGNPALSVTAVLGGEIFGEGEFTTRIRGTTAGSVTFWLNGFGYSTMQSLGIEATGTGAVVALDFDWTDSGTSTAQGSTGSSFINCYFGCNASSRTGSTACRCGNSGVQVDTSTFVNCYFANAGSGFSALNFNCLNHSLIGGQFIGNLVGIYCPSGSCENISGPYFANNDTWDIQLTGGLVAYSIYGCRTESAHFLNIVSAGIMAHVHACNHQGTSLGTFFQGNSAGTTHIDGCTSVVGQVVMTGGSSIGQVTIQDCNFSRFDAINLGSNAALSTIFLKNTMIGDIRYGLGRYIMDQRLSNNVTRTLNLEAADVSTDRNFLYDSYASSAVRSALLNSLPATYPYTISFSVASPTVITLTSGVTYFQGGEPVAFSLAAGGSAMPTGITADKVYFVTKDSLVNTPLTGSTFHISDTQAHALAGTNTINVSGAGTGPFNMWSARKWAVGDQVLNTGAAAGGSPGWICTTAGWAAAVAAGETQAVFKALANVAA